MTGCTLALEYTGLWCCDQHPDNHFNFELYFLGPMYIDEPVECAKRKRSAQVLVRKVIQCKPLNKILCVWRFDCHQNHDLRFIRPASFILDDNAIKTLCRIHPTKLTCSSDITTAPKETSEWHNDWAQKLFEIILDYGEGRVQLNSRNDEQGEAEDQDDEDDRDEDSNDVESTKELDEMQLLPDDVEETEEPEEMPSPKRSKRSNRIIVAPTHMPVLVNRPNASKHR